MHADTPTNYMIGKGHTCATWWGGFTEQVQDVLLDGTARQRAGLSWYRPARVQLLAAPGHDGESDAPVWSALLVDGVAVSYDDVVGVRMDESALEFIVEHKPSSPTAQDEPLQHLRMFTRSEFNLWREALYPKITNPVLPVDGIKPTAHAAAQKWLAHKLEDAAASSSL